MSTRRVGCRVVAAALSVALPLAAACSGTGESTTPGDAGGATGGDERCATTGVEEVRDVRYARSPGVAASAQSLDLYLPEQAVGCPPVPVVVWVHGGGFRVGDKANGMAGKVALVTGEGWALASVNYRLVDDERSGPRGGRFPDPQNDLAAALAHLHAGAEGYGIDPGRTGLLGHSAGAALVALVGTDGGFLEDQGLGLGDLAAVASLDTTYDIPGQVAGGGANAAMYRAAFGDDPDVWRLASPQAAAEEAAPGSLPPFLVVTRGQSGRVAQSEAFAAAVRDAGGEAEVVVADGLTHAQVNTAVGTPGDTTVTPPLLAFLRAHL